MENKQMLKLNYILLAIGMQYKINVYAAMVVLLILNNNVYCIEIINRTN